MAVLDVFLKLTDEQILALTIYGEARGEAIEGKVAVGAVILNRVGRPGWWGADVHSVCLKKYQFSCYLESDPNCTVLQMMATSWDDRIKTHTALRECYWVAKGLMERWLQSNVKDATHYHTLVITPSWTRRENMQHITDIGHHRFYVEMA